ncbi:hypothetical protein [Actinomadura livida]|uniref:DNA-binding transcriptional regulator YbjK n=1 Tax=Actinomadura livida TaxID=79909 RepID=A0A7W7IID9_9ACTN|nr:MULTISPECIES: hypothetical protein [Actinomadura]MBB4777686.1 DNA-binding transcriptional regulator YbjK [Actinomadura catellatispora]GGT99396.1 hypothetical protein GCM10010208_23870 [Actinomadura livida]
MTNEIQDERSLNALAIAMEWAKLPSEHLQSALAALEPQLVREHELNKLRIEAMERNENLRIEVLEKQAKRAFVLYVLGLVAGFLVVVGMLVSAVIVGIKGNPWLAAMLSGPSVLALATLFVLRRHTSDNARYMARNQSEALASATNPPV